LSTLLTLFTKIPIGKSYLHLGNVVSQLSAISLGPIEGGIVGGLGQALADYIKGYNVFIIPTLIIKFLSGFIFGIITRKEKKYIILCSACFIYFVITALGYFFFKIFFLGLDVKIALFGIIRSIIANLAVTFVTISLVPFLKIIN
jgi:uncharacterized membrane protein